MVEFCCCSQIVKPMFSRLAQSVFGRVFLNFFFLLNFFSFFCQMIFPAGFRGRTQAVADDTCPAVPGKAILYFPEAVQHAASDLGGRETSLLHFCSGLSVCLQWDWSVRTEMQLDTAFCLSSWILLKYLQGFRSVCCQRRSCALDVLNIASWLTEINSELGYKLKARVKPAVSCQLPAL